MLTALVLLPLLAALGLLFVPANYRFAIRAVALAATFATMLLGLRIFLGFDAAPAGAGGFKFVQQISWVPVLDITWFVGVDGLNIGLLLMATVVAFAAACVSHEIQSQEKLYYVLLLVMTGGILGAFAFLDVFFLYCFHELALVPTFIMIGLWGRGPERNYATFQITLYLSLGALLALFGLIALYLQLPPTARTFDLVKLTAHFQAAPMAANAQQFIFPLLLFGFGILVSLWPFHTWAPTAYAAAPTATAMLHAGVLKKFGLYGLIRVALPLMPQAAQSWLQVLALLCLGNLLYAGWVAMRQRDFNLLLGNSSVAHMGFAFLGISSLSLVGLTGAVLVMVAHGLLAALSFGLSGYLRAQTRTLNMDELGGLLGRMPFIGAALVMAALAGCGLPGFANFAGEITVLFGAWKTLPWFVVAAAWGGLVIGALYMLRAVRAILHGEGADQWTAVTDASAWRKVPFVLLLAGLIAFGCWPRALTDKIKTAAAPIVKMATAGATSRTADPKAVAQKPAPPSAP